MDNTRFQDLYYKYLNNSISSTELDEFYELINQLPNSSELLDPTLFSDTTNPKEKLSEQESAEILTNIWAINNSRKVIVWKRIIPAAAAILLMAFAGLWYFNLNQTNIQIVFENNSNQPKNLTLEDGTKVILRKNSKIIQTTDFQRADKRSVKLFGEAFFDVATNKKQPFEVSTDKGIHIEVLGTRFNFIATAKKQEVVLTEGSIAMHKGSQSLKLKPSEKATLSNEMDVLEKATVDTLKYMSWTSQQMYFKEESLIQVIQAINQAYPDKQVLIPNAFNQLKFTGYLPENNINQCIDILTTSFQHYNLVISVK